MICKIEPNTNVVCITYVCEYNKIKLKSEYNN
jgi:hypothetical protein